MIPSLLFLVSQVWDGVMSFHIYRQNNEINHESSLFDIKYGLGKMEYTR